MNNPKLLLTYALLKFSKSLLNAFKAQSKGVVLSLDAGCIFMTIAAPMVGIGWLFPQALQVNRTGWIHHVKGKVRSKDLKKRWELKVLWGVRGHHVDLWQHTSTRSSLVSRVV
ncbi:hypothetical protein V8B97DRAFT_1920091 [Scleroderma yunnanense]